ncbi:unnamed protein product, partial [Brenthis ino]
MKPCRTPLPPPPPIPTVHTVCSYCASVRPEFHLHTTGLTIALFYKAYNTTLIAQSLPHEYLHTQISAIFQAPSCMAGGASPAGRVGRAVRVGRAGRPGRLGRGLGGRARACRRRRSTHRR